MCDYLTVEYFDDLKIYITLQKWLKNLTTDNLSDIVKSISNSIFAEEKNLNVLCNEICYIATIRLNRVSILAELIAELTNCENINKRNFLDIMMTNLFDFDIPNLVFLLYKKKLIKGSEIYERVKSLKAQLFFKEETLSKELSEDLIMYLGKKYMEKEEEIDQLREFCWVKDSIGYAIKFDDINLLQKLTRQKGFDFQQQIKWSPFESQDVDIQVEPEKPKSLVRPTEEEEEEEDNNANDGGEVSDLPKVSLIDLAAYFGSVNCFEYLKNNGSKITEFTMKFAVAGTNLSIIKSCENLLNPSLMKIAIHYHADELIQIIYKDSDPCITFQDALSYHNYTALNYLLQKKKDINELTEFGSRSISALIIAITNCRTDLVEILTKYGADVNLPDTSGTFPIHYAVKCNSLETMRLLIKLGANIEERDKKGFTPLHDAVVYHRRNDYSLIKELLDIGADPNSKTNKGRTVRQSVLITKDKVLENLIDEYINKK